MIPPLPRHLHFDTPVGQWDLYLASPPPDLAGVVDTLWEVCGRARYIREKILPAANIELMFNLGLPHQVVDREDESRAEQFRAAWISGLQERYLLIEPCYLPGTHDAHHVSVRLTPGGAQAVFGMPMSELSNRVFELDTVLGMQILRVRERLLNTPSVPGRLAVLADFVRGRLAVTGLRPRTELLASLDLLHGTHGMLPVEKLALRLGCTRQHLKRVFDTGVGLGVKRYARLLKFKRVLEYVETRNEVNWSAIAHACGYYDQAHFNREFRLFAGATPGEYLARRAPGGGATIEPGLA